MIINLRLRHLSGYHSTNNSGNAITNLLLYNINLINIASFTKYIKKDISLVNPCKQVLIKKINKINKNTSFIEL